MAGDHPGSNWRRWQVPAFEPGWRNTTYDARGVGETRSRTPSPWPIDVHAGDVARLIETRCQPPVALDAAVTFAPAGDVVVAALRTLDRGGTVAINAIHLDRVPEFPYDLLWWERCIRSVANVTRQDAREFIELAAAIPVRADIEVHPLADANLALQRVASGEVHGAAVLVP